MAIEQIILSLADVYVREIMIFLFIKLQLFLKALVFCDNRSVLAKGGALWIGGYSGVDD